MICILALALLLAGCRAPAITITPYQPTALILPTRTPITLPTRLPTLTRQPTQTPTTTFTPLPPSTAVPTYPTNTPALTTESSEAITITPTLDALSLYEQSTALCQAAFEPGTVLTTTQPGTHLPTFVLRNRPYDDVYWEALTGLEWLEAENTDQVRSLVCIQAGRRQDATYSDESIGYTLRWDVRLISWPEGWLIASESFWGQGPPVQNTSGAVIYGTPPSEQLLNWLACDLQPDTANMLCLAGGPLAFSPNGQTLIAGQDAWSMPEKQKTATYPGHSAEVNLLALAPDGRTVASVAAGEGTVGDSDIHLWRAGDGQLLHRLDGHGGEITALAFSPDSQWLLSASQDGSLNVWDVQNGTHKQTLAENLGWLHALAISPDGKLVAAGVWAQPGLVYIWDLQAAIRAGGTREPLHQLEASEIHVNALAFSPDNLLLASAGLDGSVRLWDAAEALKPDASMRLVGLLQGHRSSVNSLSFSPDSKRLASGSDDKSVIVWDVASGKIWRTLPGAPGAVISVVYSPDGQWLAASSKKLVRIWPSP